MSLKTRGFRHFVIWIMLSAMNGEVAVRVSSLSADAGMTADATTNRFTTFSIWTRQQCSYLGHEGVKLSSELMFEPNVFFSPDVKLRRFLRAHRCLSLRHERCLRRSASIAAWTRVPRGSSVDPDVEARDKRFTKRGSLILSHCRWLPPHTDMTV